jgi:DNA polymerase-3 subunit delta'
MHHAYLFAGPSGSGKREMARFLAQLANCESDGERPCGVCHQCHLIETGNHPDVSWIGPSEKSKKGHITIEQAQAVRTEISRIPVLGRRKVVTLDPADEMTQDAVNCLLKTFEEPPAYATLVLLVGDTANILPTVLSRCQVTRFKPAPRDVIAAWLIDQGADAEQAGHVARLSEGRPGEALRLLKDAEALAKRERTLVWLKAVALAPRTDALRLAEDLRMGTSDEGADVADSLRWAGSWFRDISAIQARCDRSLVVNADHLDTLEAASRSYTTTQALAAAAAILSARRYLAGNGNATLVTECLLMDLIPWGDS